MRDACRIPESVDAIDADILRAVGVAGDIELRDVVRVGVDRGFTGLVARVDYAVDGVDHRAALKLPDPDHFERAERERRVLAEVALPVPTARLLGSAVDAERQRVALLLEWIDGTAGDCLARCDDSMALRVAEDLARLHQIPEVPRWLPRWGRGTGGAGAPHRRRAERFRRRRFEFVSLHGGPPWLPDLLDSVGHSIEDDFAHVFALPETFIHADGHVENLMTRATDEAIVWIDWQTSSRGPGLYDLVRFLAETLPASSMDLALACRIRYLDAGGAVHDGTDWHVMLRCVLAGFISGFGGRAPEALLERERALVAQVTGENGLVGFVRNALDRPL